MFDEQGNTAQLKKQKHFVALRIENLRGKYGLGRVPLKISLPPERFEAMSDLGVIKAQDGSDGRKVASRGGQGSPFIDLSLEVMEFILTEFPNPVDQRRAAANLLRRIDDAIFHAEDAAVIKSNLLTFYELITGKTI